MPTLGDVFRFQADNSEKLISAPDSALSMISRRMNEVLAAAAAENGKPRHQVHGYELPDTTELKEESLRIFEGLKRDVNAL